MSRCLIGCLRLVAETFISVSYTFHTVKLTCRYSSGYLSMIKLVKLFKHEPNKSAERCQSSHDKRDSAIVIGYLA